jgi:hypothetical protein
MKTAVAFGKRDDDYDLEVGPCRRLESMLVGAIIGLWHWGKSLDGAGV